MLRFKDFLNRKDKIPIGYVIKFNQFNPNLFENEHEDLDKLESELRMHYDLTPHEQSVAEKYFSNSFPANAQLIGLHHLNLPVSENLSTVHEMDAMCNKKPLGREMTVYSGLTYDPKRNLSSNGLIHFPAYTSTSTDLDTAFRFTGDDPDRYSHILKISLKPADRGVYIGKPFTYHGMEMNEREFVLPRNTTMRITKSEYSGNVATHHAELVHNVNPDDIDRDPLKIPILSNKFHNVFKTAPGVTEVLKQHTVNPDVDAIKKNISENKYNEQEMDNLEQNYPNSEIADFVRGYRGPYKVVRNFARGIFDGNGLYDAKDRGYFETIKPQIIHHIKNVLANRFSASHIDGAGIHGLLDSEMLTLARNSLAEKLKRRRFDYDDINSAIEKKLFDEELRDLAARALTHKLNTVGIVENPHTFSRYNYDDLKIANKSGLMRNHSLAKSALDAVLRKMREDDYESLDELAEAGDSGIYGMHEDVNSQLRDVYENLLLKHIKEGKFDVNYYTDYRTGEHKHVADARKFGINVSEKVLPAIREFLSKK